MPSNKPWTPAKADSCWFRKIALTPQTVRRFYEIFGDDIAVLHSRLNDREAFRGPGPHCGGGKKRIGYRGEVGRVCPPYPIPRVLIIV